MTASLVKIKKDYDGREKIKEPTPPEGKRKPLRSPIHNVAIYFGPLTGRQTAVVEKCFHHQA